MIVNEVINSTTIMLTQLWVMTTYDIFYILGQYNLPQEIGSKWEGPKSTQAVDFSQWLYTIAKKKKLAVLILNGAKSTPGYHIVRQQIKFSPLLVSISFPSRKKIDSQHKVLITGHMLWVIRIRDWINTGNVTATLLQLKYGKAIS